MGVVEEEEELVAAHLLGQIITSQPDAKPLPFCADENSSVFLVNEFSYNGDCWLRVSIKNTGGKNKGTKPV